MMKINYDLEMQKILENIKKEGGRNLNFFFTHVVLHVVQQ